MGFLRERFSLKMIFIAELFIVTMLSPGQLRHNNSDNAEKCSFTIGERGKLSLSVFSQLEDEGRHVNREVHLQVCQILAEVSRSNVVIFLDG